MRANVKPAWYLHQIMHICKNTGLKNTNISFNLFTVPDVVVI